jgi:succinate dehydrogenase hydrophobic anchor subunit
MGGVMMKRGLAMATGVLMALALVWAVGCASTEEGVEQTQTVAQEVVTETSLVIADLEREIALLPADDPARPFLEERLAELRKINTGAQAVVTGASQVLTDMENGELSQETRDALNLLPYGAYVGLGLSVIFGLRKRQVASRLQGHLSRVVESWQQVGAELTEDEKDRAFAIQGPEVPVQVQANPA